MLFTTVFLIGLLGSSDYRDCQAQVLSMITPVTMSLVLTGLNVSFGHRTRRLLTRHSPKVAVT